jgi:hypothetical protein
LGFGATLTVASKDLLDKRLVFQEIVSSGGSTLGYPTRTERLQGIGSRDFSVLDAVSVRGNHLLSVSFRQGTHKRIEYGSVIKV